LRAGKETVQIYASWPDTAKDAPLRKLVGFKKVSLDPGEESEITIDIPGDLLNLTSDEGQPYRYKGKFTLHVGGGQPDERTAELTGSRSLAVDARVDI